MENNLCSSNSCPLCSFPFHSLISTLIFNFSTRNFIIYYSDYTIGSASHYGCAIIIKDGVSGTSARGETLQNDRVAYLACLFVAAIHLTSTRGEMSDHSCYLYNGMAQYFSSLETTLCVHNSKQHQPHQ